MKAWFLETLSYAAIVGGVFSLVMAPFIGAFWKDVEYATFGVVLVFGGFVYIRRKARSDSNR